MVTIGVSGVHYVPVNSETAHAPWANPAAFDFFEKFWSNSPICCQFRRSNAPPIRASIRRSNPLPSRHVKATVQIFFQCIKPFIEMYIFCNKQLANVLVVLRHTFTYEEKLIQLSQILNVNKDDRQKIACVARRFKQSERAEKVPKLRKLASKPWGTCCSFLQLCSFVPTIRLLKPLSDAGYQKKEML